MWAKILVINQTFNFRRVIEYKKKHHFLMVLFL